MLDPNLLCVPWCSWPVNTVVSYQQKETRYLLRGSESTAQQRWPQLRLYLGFLTKLKSLDQLCGAERSFPLVTFGTWLPIIQILHLAVLHSCTNFEGGVSLPAVVSSSRIRQPPVPNKCSFYSCWGRSKKAQMRAVLLNMQCLGQSSSRGHPEVQHPWSSWAVWGWRAKPQLSISRPSPSPTKGKRAQWPLSPCQWVWSSLPPALCPGPLLLALCLFWSSSHPTES